MNSESNWPDRWINGAAPSGSHTAFRACLQSIFIAAASDQLLSHPRSNWRPADLFPNHDVGLYVPV